MLKKLYLTTIFLICFSSSIDGKYQSKKEIVSISSGTSFGMCMTYCRRSINITTHPYKLLAIKQPNSVEQQQQYPIVQQQYPYSAQQWNRLLSLVNIKKFLSLDERIGCPDCADGGAEWIQIDWPQSTKIVTFEYQKTIEGFDRFIKHLRQLREQTVNLI